jgi:predicted nucleotidyltransferase
VIADHEAAVEVAARVAERCASILGANMRSVALYGSLVAGDFIPSTSDIDLLVVVDAPLTASDVTALEEVVRATDLATASGMDLHVVTSAVASDPATSAALALHIGRYDNSSLVQVEHDVADEPDLLPELSLARATAQRLLGEDPRDVLGAVPPERVRERGRYWLTTWQSRTDDDSSAALMVLTACRIWRFAVEEVHSSKVQAGRWALTRSPSLTAVTQALRRHTTDPTAPIDEPGINDVLAAVLNDIGEATRRG